MIRWKYPTPFAFKNGQAVGYADHGQYWRGHESPDPDPALKAKVWFAVYKPYGGTPVLLDTELLTAHQMYKLCTDHDKEMLGRTA